MKRAARQENPWRPLPRTRMGRRRSSRLTVFSPAKVNELLLSSEGPRRGRGQRGIGLRAVKRAAKPANLAALTTRHPTGVDVLRTLPTAAVDIAFGRGAPVRYPGWCGKNRTFDFGRDWPEPERKVSDCRGREGDICSTSLS